MADPPARADPWVALRRATLARVGLARAGDTLAAPELLAFQAAHAAARDAVHAPLDPAALAQALTPWPALTLRSRASDRATYLRRPDLGRRLDEASRATLAPEPGGVDLVFVLADGLSAGAVQRHGAHLVAACRALLPELTIGPTAIVSQARVAIGDEVGEALASRAVIVLIGERPGLSIAESLGAYLTWSPRLGRRDSERNCVSNIHSPDGLPLPAAAALLARLLHGAAILGASGVNLKDSSAALSEERPGLCPGPAGA